MRAFFFPLFFPLLGPSSGPYSPLTAPRFCVPVSLITTPLPLADKTVAYHRLHASRYVRSSAGEKSGPNFEKCGPRCPLRTALFYRHPASLRSRTLIRYDNNPLFSMLLPHSLIVFSSPIPTSTASCSPSLPRDALPTLPPALSPLSRTINPIWCSRLPSSQQPCLL